MLDSIQYFMALKQDMAYSCHVYIFRAHGNTFRAHTSSAGAPPPPPGQYGDVALWPQQRAARLCKEPPSGPMGLFWFTLTLKNLPFRVSYYDFLI